MFPPDFSDEKVNWLCNDAIIDLQFRELNARSSFMERNGMKFDLHYTGGLHCTILGSFRFVGTGKRRDNNREFTTAK